MLLLPRRSSAACKKNARETAVKLIGIDNAGHWPFIDQPDAFAQRLLAILFG